MQDQLLTELGRDARSGIPDRRGVAGRDRRRTRFCRSFPTPTSSRSADRASSTAAAPRSFRLLDEIVANLARHKMIVGAGAGARASHAFGVGLDLGMPTGVLSVLSTFVSMQNARMLHYLLAKHGIPFVAPVAFAQLPLYLEERRAVVFFGMPPYIYWQPNPAVGRIPPHRTDTGAYLVSEVFGARSMIYVKDEDGLYTADPKKDPSATFIPSDHGRGAGGAGSGRRRRRAQRPRHDEERPAPPLDPGDQRAEAGQPDASAQRRAVGTIITA